jgi:alpha-2-macroglobulin
MRFVHRILFGLLILLSPAAAAEPLTETLSAADRYSDDIHARLGTADDPEEATALRLAGATAAQAGATDAAIASYERAVALGGGTAETWFALAKLQRDRDDDWSAIGAAYQAYTLSDDPAARADALDLIGSLLQALDKPAEALAAYQLALQEAPQNGFYQDRVAYLTDLVGLHVDNVEVDRSNETPRFCFTFNASVLDVRQVHYERFVTAEPAFTPVFSTIGASLCINGAEYGKAYKITLAEGLPSAEDRALIAAESFDLQSGDRDPSLGFDGTAYVLPKASGHGVPLVSVNLDHAKLELLRVNDRNLAREIDENRLLRALDGYDRNDIVQRYGALVWSGDVLIENEPNKRVVTSVPLDEMLPDTEPGVYLLLASLPSQTEEDPWTLRATQWLVVTDLGLTAMSGEDGLNLFVRSLETGEPLGRAEAKLIARNNEELAVATTDRSGLAHFDAGLLRGDGGKQAIAVYVTRRNGDFAFLDLTQPAFDLSDRGVGGRLAKGPTDAYLYTDRGVYRPGETVHLAALLRDAAGHALGDLPLTLRVLRPDGSEEASLKLASQGLGGYQQDIAISSTARTGSWSVEAYLDPNAPAIATSSFLVEQVVPARIEVKLESNVDFIDPRSEEAPTVEATADYLYGAPGADLPVNAEALVRLDDDPFPGLPGYRFGLADETIDPARTELEATRTDEAGKASLEIFLDQVPDTVQPLKATVRVEVRDVGGRAVAETLDLPLRNRDLFLGIKPLFADDTMPEQGTAAFDAIAVAPDGEPQPVAELQYRLVREDWDYQWFLQNGQWNYHAVVRDVPGTSGTFALAADAPGRIELPVEYGRYRVELYDPATGAAASYRFTAGWYATAGTGDTPDTLQVTADKPLYQPGDRARLFVRPPFAGQVLLAIATDRILETRIVDATPNGIEVAFDVNAAWGAGAYLLATAFRPSDAAGHGPARAIGVTWLGIDPALRRLEVSFAPPAVARPRETVEIPVSVAGLAPGSEAYVTVAAVDEGVLQLTDFASPDPLGFFFGKRRLGVDIRDLYGRLIDADQGRRGQIRTGGDAGLSRRAAPPGIELVALFSGILKLDAEGKAQVRFAIPDYNGRLRLMAVAYDADKVGSAEAGLVVSDPLVSIIATPRFLSPGDRSTLTLSLQNLEAPAGSYHVALTTDDALQLGDGASFDAALPAGAGRTVAVPLLGRSVGTGHIRLAVDGPDGYHLEREVTLGVRPAQLPEVKRIARQLAPGEGVTLGPDLLAGFLPNTGEVLASVSAHPDLDLAGLLRSLDRYPYGCLEQTTSRAMPLLYVGDVARAIGLADDDAALERRVQGAIGRILEMQRWDGSFALWDSYGGAETWLTGYAMDFLTRARAKDYVVPDYAYKQGIAWLKYHAADHQDDGDAGLASRAYALYVLASAGAGDAGLARYFFDRNAERMPNRLAAAHLGAALALLGDQARASQAIAIALDEKRRWSPHRGYDYYGTDLRDLAATTALVAESKAPGVDLSALVARLQQRLESAPYLSTQEEGWTLMAGAALSGDQAMRIAVNDQAAENRTRPLYLHADQTTLAGGLRLANAGAAPVWTTASVFGVSTEEKPAAQDQGYRIKRRYYDLAGSPIALDAVPQNEVVVVVVTLSDAAESWNQSLLIDLLPAGFEIENLRLANARQTGDFDWLPDLAETNYTEYLDDRFVAAFTSYSGSDYSFAYMMRAVTPGRYRVPASEVEDMYLPARMGRTEMGEAEILAAP